ncbi:MAG: 2OG-Fe(II) oxygenase [Gammaproteobacteria bacterium]|nr:2OG-Fe(II) oxygenase [Gammaproteobacteria bacterium]
MTSDPMDIFTPEQLEAVLDGLTGPGWVVLRSVGSPELRAALRAELNALRESGGLKAAGVGQGGAHRRNEDIRGDSIAWLDATASPAQAQYLAGIDQLIAELNRQLFLGLKDAEAHFAWYTPEAFYKPHLDRFRSDDARTVSTVFYLNPDWPEDGGGELEIYDPEDPERLIARVPPEDGSLAVFLSDRIWHAVAPTRRDRLSIAGWLRRPRLH